MKTIETAVRIEASPQTVWSIMDDLARYPEWNALTPDLAGRTTVGSVVRGTLAKEGAPNVPLRPVVTVVVGAREFRWLTLVPGDQGFSAEHYFTLTPTADGGTQFSHCEDFDGPAITARWAGIQATSPVAFDGMNQALKVRAEQFEATPIKLHPAVDALCAPRAREASTTLRCRCPDAQVEIHLVQPVYHNHLCGCSQCWKPPGALLAQTAVVSSAGLELGANQHKLAIVDPTAAVRRHACGDCGVHLYGDVPDLNHHFYGLCFVHPELAADGGCDTPEFAGFVSSIIETGTSPSLMRAVRSRLAALGIPAFDAFSSELMDLIAWHRRKIAHNPQPTS